MKPGRRAKSERLESGSVTWDVGKVGGRYEDGTRQRRQSLKSVGRRAATARSVDGEVDGRRVDDETFRSVRL